MAGGSVLDAGDPEVEHLQGPVARRKDVRGLDVPVNDPFGVCGGEDVEELIGDGEDRPRVKPLTAALHEGLQPGPVQQLHDKERRPILSDVVVHDEHRPRVLDRVGRVPLAQEASAHVLAHAQLRVEHLDRELGLVAVRRLEDDGHAADAQDAVEAVLAAQDGAEPSLSTGNLAGRHRLDDPCGRREPAGPDHPAREDSRRRSAVTSLPRAASPVIRLSCVNRDRHGGPASSPNEGGLAPAIRPSPFGRLSASAVAPVRAP